MSNNYLIVLDVDSIHDYVFATNKLREIRGASSLIDELILDDIWRIAESFKYKVIFSAGGTSLIKAKDAEREDEVKAFIEKLTETFKEKTHIATFSADWIVHPEETPQFSEVRDRLYEKLKVKKLSKGMTKDIVTNPFFKFCMACGTSTAEVRHPAEKDNPDSYVCLTCEKRIRQGNREQKQKSKKKNNNGSNDIYSYFYKQVKDAQFPKDLSEIGVRSVPPNYIGFIYADGNQIGERLKNIKEEPEYKDFSYMLDKSTKKSAVEAAVEYVSKDLPVKPVEFILAGGDDLIMIVPGSAAIQVAIKFCELFENKTKTKENPYGLTTSVGLTISHANYPIKSLLRISEVLLKAAKSKGWDKDTRTTANSMINFLIIKGSMADPDRWNADLKYRSSETGHHEMCMTCRPYTVQDLEKMVSSIKALKASGFPGTRLKRIREILLKDKAGSVLEFSDLLSRASGKDGLKAMFSIIDSFHLDFMPWRYDDGKFHTPFLDIVELYDFIPQDGAA